VRFFWLKNIPSGNTARDPEPVKVINFIPTYVYYALFHFDRLEIFELTLTGQNDPSLRQKSFWAKCHPWLISRTLSKNC
jgi:hypothetical protein